ncbi:MAG: hypothetical protein U1F64_13610 [Burkholderiales bacterium]
MKFAAETPLNVASVAAVPAILLPRARDGLRYRHAAATHVVVPIAGDIAAFFRFGDAAATPSGTWTDPRCRE